MKIKTVLMFVLALSLIAFAYYSKAIVQAQTRKTSAPKTNMTTATISISGMSCESCAIQIRNLLAKTRGVKSSVVSYKSGRAIVRYDPNATSVGAIRSAIEALGYKADDTKGVERHPPASTSSALAELPINKLQKEFNLASDKVRVLSILSPTCDGCKRGRGVVAEMFDQQKSENLVGLVVWLPMKSRDSAKTAVVESDRLKDQRIKVRGWDGNREIGKLFGKALNLSGIAWDVYLVYDAGVKWEERQPPEPNYWMHQLQGQPADTMLCLNPAALANKVKEYLNKD